MDVKFCEFCGTVFQPATHNQRFCKNVEHKTECYHCEHVHVFWGNPRWQYNQNSSKNNVDLKYVCSQCTQTRKTLRRAKTMHSRYGSTSYNNRSQAQITMLEKYGGKTTLESPELYEKHVRTMQEKYGAPTIKQGSRAVLNAASKRARCLNVPIETALATSVLLSDQNALKMRILSFGEKLGRKPSIGELAVEVDSTPTEVSHILSNRFPSLRDLVKAGGSFWEAKITAHLGDLGFGWVLHTRILDGLEIDVLIKDFVLQNDFRVGFEVNDFFTHSKTSNLEPVTDLRFLKKLTYKHGPEYHENKTKIALEKNIHLIHVWQDDIESGKYKTIVTNSLR